MDEQRNARFGDFKGDYSTRVEKDYGGGQERVDKDQRYKETKEASHGSANKGRKISVMNFFTAVRLLNALAIIGLILVAVYFIVMRGCNKRAPHPATPGAADGLDPSELLDFIDSLNVLTNVLIAIPGVMFAVMGFAFEGSLLVLTAIFSCLWHASGWKLFEVADTALACATFAAMLTGFLRVCQVRGFPEFGAFYVALPVGALIFFGANTSPCQEKGTSYAKDRISHVVWHVMAAVCFVVVAIEVLRTPDLLPNRRLAAAVEFRNADMRARSERSRGGSSPNRSLVIGLVEDLFGGTGRKN